MLNISQYLPDVQAFVLDPLAAVAVGVLKSKVVVWSEFLREDVVCGRNCQFTCLACLMMIVRAYRPQPRLVGCSSGRL